MLNPDSSYAWSSSDTQQSESMMLLLNRDSIKDFAILPTASKGNITILCWLQVFEHERIARKGYRQWNSRFSQRSFTRVKHNNKLLKGHTTLIGLLTMCIEAEKSTTPIASVKEIMCNIQVTKFQSRQRSRVRLHSHRSSLLDSMALVRLPIPTCRFSSPAGLEWSPRVCASRDANQIILCTLHTIVNLQSSK
jgi:hypothetical protein